MVIQINTNIAAMAQDLILIQKFLLQMEAWENVIICGADMNLSVHIDNKNKDILILGNGPAQGLDDTTLTAEALYPINFTQPNKIFVLSLHCNESNSILFVNATKIHQFKVKDSELKNYALCLGNISKDFAINNMKKTRLKEIVKYLSVDFDSIDTNDIQISINI